MWLLVSLSLIGQIDWSTVKTNANVDLSYKITGYDDPVIVGSGVNTLGWEDSAELNGTTLMWWYSRMDLTLADSGDTTSHIHTPPRSEYPSNEARRLKGAFYTAALKSDGTFENVSIAAMRPSPMNTPESILGELVRNLSPDAPLDGSQTLTNDSTCFNKRSILFSRSLSGNRRGIFMTQEVGVGRWSPAALFGGNVNASDLTANTADNPFCRSGYLYFEKENGSNNLDIYRTALPAATTITALTDINTTADESQAWVAANGDIYFSRDFAGLFMWDESEAEVVLLALADGTNTAVAGIGEPSLADNGDIYFVFIFKAYDNAAAKWFYDADICKLPKTP